MKKLQDGLYYLALLGLAIWFAYTKGWILADFESVDANTAAYLIEHDENVTILDVRTIPEYKEGHLVNATLIPLDQLQPSLNKLDGVKEKKVLVYCRSGNRSISASRILKAHGFVPVNVKGGIIALSQTEVQITK